MLPHSPGVERGLASDTPGTQHHEVFDTIGVLLGWPSVERHRWCRKPLSTVIHRVSDLRSSTLGWL
jgi:hypothetical protein